MRKNSKIIKIAKSASMKSNTYNCLFWQKGIFSHVLRLCGEQIFVCDHLRKSAVSTSSLNLACFAPLRSPCGVLISTQAEYAPQGVTPQGESSSKRKTLPFCFRCQLRGRPPRTLFELGNPRLHIQSGLRLP